MAETSGVVNPKVTTCHSCSSEAKYRCPACSILSCSVACVKSHKEINNCNGIKAEPEQDLDKILLEEYR